MGGNSEGNGGGGGGWKGRGRGLWTDNRSPVNTNTILVATNSCRLARGRTP